MQVAGRGRWGEGAGGKDWKVKERRGRGFAGERGWRWEKEERQSVEQSLCQRLSVCVHCGCGIWPQSRLAQCRQQGEAGAPVCWGCQPTCVW